MSGSVIRNHGTMIRGGIGGGVTALHHQERWGLQPVVCCGGPRHPPTGSQASCTMLVEPLMPQVSATR
jgi:hypothetical protein